MLVSALSSLFILWGTYKLSKKLFDELFKYGINIPYEKLPFLFRIMLIVFGNKSKYKDKTLWEQSSFPTEYNLKPIKKLYEPFFGFCLIFIGMLIQVIFG